MFAVTNLTLSARKRWLNWKVAALYAVVTVLVPWASLVLYESNQSTVALLQHVSANFDRYLDILVVFGSFAAFGHTFIFRTLACQDSLKETKSKGHENRVRDGD